MAHKLLREQAIKLRLQGYTYGQIKRELGTSKSTLSGWLAKLPLGTEQLILLSNNKALSKDYAVEKCIATRKRQRLEKLKRVLDIQTKELLPLTERELFIAGLFLYWGEGNKQHGPIIISNTDPRVLKFTLYWMVNILGIPKERVKVGLHIYKDMEINETISYWSEILEIPKEQFQKPYIKKTNREGLTYKGFGHGTCKLYFGSVDLSEKIAMSIKAISDLYGAKDDIFWYN